MKIREKIIILALSAAVGCSACGGSAGTAGETASGTQSAAASEVTAGSSSEEEPSAEAPGESIAVSDAESAGSEAEPVSDESAASSEVPTAESGAASAVSAVEQTESGAAAESAGESVSPEIKEEEKTIGTPAEGNGVITVTLTNGTGANITAFQIKNIYEGDYPDSLLADGDAFAADETRTLYYDTDPESDSSASDAESAQSTADVECNVKVTFEDGSSKSITMFPFDDMEEGTLLLSDDGTLYVTYTSLESGEAKDTLGSEGAYRESKEKAAEAAANQRSSSSSGSKKKSSRKSNSSGGANECIGDDGLLY